MEGKKECLQDLDTDFDSHLISNIEEIGFSNCRDASLTGKELSGSDVVITVACSKRNRLLVRAKMCE